MFFERIRIIVFFYLRHYPTFSELGRQFGITESYANKTYHLVSDILVKLKNVPNRKVLFEGGLEKILVDVTEQQIERPLKKQKDYYSGKKKKHTIKVQLIVCSITLRILSVYCEKGSVHDFKIFKDSKLLIASKIKILAERKCNKTQSLSQTVTLALDQLSYVPLRNNRPSSGSQHPALGV